MVSRFLGVGAFATGLQYLLLAALAGAAGWPPVMAASVAYAVSAGVNYNLSRHWTFTEKPLQPARRTLPRFLLINGLALLLNAAGVSAGLAAGWALMVAQGVTTVGLTVFNYAMMRCWVFATERAT